MWLLQLHTYWCVCVGRPCGVCSCFDSVYALRECTRKGHNRGRPSIRAGKLTCMYCVADQKLRSKTSQLKWAAQRNSDHKRLRKKLPRGEVKVLYIKFKQLETNITSGLLTTKKDKTNALKWIQMSTQFMYPFSELQILYDNYKNAERKKNKRNTD